MATRPAGIRAEPHVAIRTGLGESPLYRPQDNTLHYIDVLGNAIHVLQLSEPRNLRTISTPKPVASLNFAAGGGYTVCYFQGVAAVGEDGSWQELCQVVKDDRVSQARINDSAVDQRGRLWFAEFELAFETPGDGPHLSEDYQPSGKLYSYSVDGTLVEHESSGIICGNGIGWTSDNSTMLFTDSFKKIIWGYDFDADSGSIANRRIVVDLRSGDGEPDGLLLDTEDNIYTFLWEGGGVLKYDLSGKLLQRWDLNAWRITHGAWVGEDFDQLMVTSAAADDNSERWPGEEAGGLFRIANPGGRGRQKHSFGCVSHNAKL